MPLNATTLSPRRSSTRAARPKATLPATSASPRSDTSNAAARASSPDTSRMKAPTQSDCVA